MVTRKIKVCDKCEEQIPDDNVISGRVFSHRTRVGPEMESFHIYFDLCPTCMNGAVEELLTLVGDKEAQEWAKKWSGGRSAR